MSNLVVLEKEVLSMTEKIKRNNHILKSQDLNIKKRRQIENENKKLIEDRKDLETKIFVLKGKSLLPDISKSKKDNEDNEKRLKDDTEGKGNVINVVNDFGREVEKLGVNVSKLPYTTIKLVEHIKDYRVPYVIGGVIVFVGKNYYGI